MGYCLDEGGTWSHGQGKLRGQVQGQVRGSRTHVSELNLCSVSNSLAFQGRSRYSPRFAFAPAGG
jgi:hypothetical protein